MKGDIFKSMLIVGIIVLFLSCSKNSSSYGNTTPPTGSNSNQVSIYNMSFSPSSTTVNKGTTITWTNNDNTTHTVTANDNRFGSGYLNKGDSFSYTFDSTGTFAYH